MKKTKIIYKEGWIEFGCAANEYPAWEKRITKVLTARGCFFVGVVQKKKNNFTFYYYSPKLFEVDEYGDPDLNRSFRYNPAVGSIDNDWHLVKPWDIMSVEEKEEDKKLAGHTYTYQNDSDALCVVAEAVLVLSSMPPKKSKDIPPNYECWKVAVDKWDDEANYTCRKIICSSRELREYDENDLSFLVRYGSPQQLVVDQMKKKQACAQKQVDKWNEVLKQIEDL